MEEDGEKQKETVKEVTHMGEFPESSDREEVKEVVHVVEDVEKTIKKEEVPIITVPTTPVPDPVPIHNPTTTPSPMELKVQQGISAASKVSNFFSLDALQEDDAWMGPKGMGEQDEDASMLGGGYDEDDDSEEDDGMMPSSTHTLRSIAEEALAATQSVNHSIHYEMQDVSLEDVQDDTCQDASTSIDAKKVDVEEDKSELWLAKYDRGVSVKIDESQWKPPPPLPVVDPFAYDAEDSDNPYLSGLRLDKSLTDSALVEAETNKLLDGKEEGGKHSWFRRTADRDSLRLMGMNMGTFLGGMGLKDEQSVSGQGHDEEGGGAGGEHFLSSSPSSNSYRMSSAMRATRAKIDHFGLLLENEV